MVIAACPRNAACPYERLKNSQTGPDSTGFSHNLVFFCQPLGAWRI
jgi:hypothetical protein